MCLLSAFTCTFADDAGTIGRVIEPGKEGDRIV